MKRPFAFAMLACLVLWLWGSANPDAQAAGGNSVSVTIGAGGFSPGSVQIKPGDTVVWTNKDTRDHQIKAENASFQSPNLPSGSSFRQTFKTAGTISYSCSYHPRERGSIIVQNN